MAFGGMAATTKMALTTAKFLQGKTWNPSSLEKSIDTLTKEMTLPAEAPGSMVRFRQILAISFLFKVIINIYQRHWIHFRYLRKPNSSLSLYNFLFRHFGLFLQGQICMQFHRIIKVLQKCLKKIP